MAFVADLPFSHTLLIRVILKGLVFLSTYQLAVQKYDGKFEGCYLGINTD